MSLPQSTGHTSSDGDRHRLWVAAASDIGPVRTENQDDWALRPAASGRAILVVADGMGGHRGGARAAAVAVAAASATLTAAEDADAAHTAAHDAANAAVGVHNRESGQDAGTTLVTAVVSEHRVTLGSIGDSRAYLVRAGGATLLTDDHSWVGEQVRAGLMTEQQAAVDPRRNMLTRAVMGGSVTADVHTAALRHGDVVVLCTDGFWGSLTVADIGAALSVSGPLEDVVAGAVAGALAAGADDNVTVVACRVHPVGGAVEQDRPR